MSSLTIFANNLKWLRTFFKMNQEELSKQLDISRSNISNYESGKNDLMLSMLIRVSNFFEIAIDDLISDELNEKIYYEKKGNTNKNKSLLDFGINLKRLRKEKGMYQSELEDKIGIKASKISLYESGRTDITLSSLSKIINCFNITIEEIASFHIDNLKFTKDEINFFKKFNITFEDVGTDSEFLRLLYDLRNYYEKQLERVNDLVNQIKTEIPDKLQEINGLIYRIEHKNDETEKH